MILICTAETDIELKDDITMCAVSDTTGRIALGSWAGSITIL
jgi:hypothetical protein